MKKNGQVWVETVIYLLIGISIIGLMIAIMKPKIDSLKDKTIIEQSQEVFKQIDEQIMSLSFSPAGNTRQLQINLKNGKIMIDGKNDNLTYILDNSRYPISEPGQPINNGLFDIITEKRGESYIIKFSKHYLLNLTLEGADKERTISPGAASQELIVATNGTIGNKIQINIE